MLIGVGIMVLSEAALFALTRTILHNHQGTDLMIVFKGSDKARIKAAYTLLQNDAASLINIPGASQKQLTKWDKKYGLPRAVSHVPDITRTRSTFEDALLAAGVIRKNGFGSVMLVTSGYHLPRAWLLLKAVTFGNGVKIYSSGVEIGKNPARLRHRVKLTYNEMVKFWGSLFEMTYFKITDRLLYANPKAAKIVRWLKTHLLFNVKQKEV